ncbi:MAG TPA: ROK family protein, partial [Actinopolymorphaceae bacterium]
MTERDDLDRLAERVDADPQARATYEDAADRERLIDEFVAARGDTPQRVVADRMRTTQSAVSDLELGRVDPRLSTLQRYARAVDSRLRVGLAGPAATEASGQVEHDTLRIGDDLTIASMLADLLKPRRQAWSSVELAERIGLPPQTVGRMAERLRDAGWLAIDPERRLQLNHDRGAVIGVGLTRGRAQAVLTSLRPDDVHARTELPLDAGSPVEVIRTIERVVDGLRPEVRPGAQLVGIGVSLAGLVDGRTGVVHFAPDLEPTAPRTADVPARSLWDGTPLADDVSFATGLRTAVENDANALAFYEYLVRPDGDDDLAAILLSESGDGIGAGLVVNGAIVHGAGGVSAEIGHVIVDDEGTTCRCGRARGCLETVASPNAIV